MNPLNKEEITQQSGKDLDFLSWVVDQTNKISEFSRIIEEIRPGEQAISMGRLREVLARFSAFYVTQTSFYLIYQEYHSLCKEKLAEIEDRMYLDLREKCSNPVDPLGKKYAKKAPTMEEIRKEFSKHADYMEFQLAKSRADEMRKKEDAQEKYLRRIDKLDSILGVLNNSAKNEMKFLHLS